MSITQQALISAEPAQVYAILADANAAEAGGTRLVIDQHGEPDDWHDHVDTNWPTFYLTPLTAHFSGQSVG